MKRVRGVVVVAVAAGGDEVGGEGVGEEEEMEISRRRRRFLRDGEGEGEGEGGAESIVSAVRAVVVVVVRIGGWWDGWSTLSSFFLSSASASPSKPLSSISSLLTDAPVWGLERWRGRRGKVGDENCPCGSAAVDVRRATCLAALKEKRGVEANCFCWDDVGLVLEVGT